MPTEITNAYQYLLAFVLCSGAIVVVSRTRESCLLQAKTVLARGSRVCRYGR